MKHDAPQRDGADRGAFGYELRDGHIAALKRKPVCAQRLCKAVNAELPIPFRKRLFQIAQECRARVGGHIELRTQLAQRARAGREESMNQLMEQCQPLLGERLITGDLDGAVRIGGAETASRYLRWT